MERKKESRAMMALPGISSSPSYRQQAIGRIRALTARTRAGVR